MKRTVSTLSLLALFCFVTIHSTAAAPADDPEAAAPAITVVKWKAMSKNLVKTLRSDNEGAKIDAMRLIIEHGSYLNVREARIDLMSIYRNHDDSAVRLMAVEALGSIGDYWSIGYLRRAMEDESSPAVWKTMRAIINDHASS